MGKSKPAKSSAIELDVFAADLRTVIALAGGRKVVLAGHSIGGMAIQTLARDDPDFFNAHVAGTLLINTIYTNPLKTMILSGLAQGLRWPVLEPFLRLAILLQPLVWLAVWQSYLSGAAHATNRLGFGRHVTRSQLEHTTLLATRSPQANLQRGNLAMFRWDATYAMSQIHSPLLVLGGGMDIVTKAEAGENISHDHVQGEFLRIAEANHMGFLERPDIYNAAITRYAIRAHAQTDKPANDVHLRPGAFGA